jgi:hypothetical protein
MRSRTSERLPDLDTSTKRRNVIAPTRVARSIGMLKFLKKRETTILLLRKNRNYTYFTLKIFDYKHAIPYSVRTCCSALHYYV